MKHLEMWVKVRKYVIRLYRHMRPFYLKNDVPQISRNNTCRLLNAGAANRLYSNSSTDKLKKKPLLRGICFLPLPAEEQIKKGIPGGYSQKEYQADEAQSPGLPMRPPGEALQSLPVANRPGNS